MSGSGHSRRIVRPRLWRHVRYCSDSDRNCATQRTVVLCHEPTYAPQQTTGYSITSSARPSRAGEIVSPNVFAVLRLMTRSNFVGCSTPTWCQRAGTGPGSSVHTVAQEALEAA